MAVDINSVVVIILRQTIAQSQTLLQEGCLLLRKIMILITKKTQQEQYKREFYNK